MWRQTEMRRAWNCREESDDSQQALAECAISWWPVLTASFYSDGALDGEVRRTRFLKEFGTTGS
jgi:hypothetical protein